MADLYNQLVSDTPTYYGQVEQNEWMNNPLNDVALNDDWVIPSLVSGGLGLFRSMPYLPYISDIAQGANLLVNKNWKNGKKFYKKVLHPKKSYNYLVGHDEITFPNSQAGKINEEYIDQLPFLRFNIDKAKSNQLMDINKINEGKSIYGLLHKK